MSLIPYPDIPVLPGVPALPRMPEFPPTVQAGIGMIQGMLWSAFQVSAQWGIYDSFGNALGNPEQMTGFAGTALQAVGLNPYVSTMSTDSVNYSKETRVSDFPVEQGSFASYNKVELPGQAVVTLIYMGSSGDKAAFLDAIDLACLSTDPYDVVTPDMEYIGYTLEGYSYQRRRDKGGATLLIVELALKEIRVVEAQYATVNIPKDAGAAASLDSGIAQATEVKESALLSIKNTLSDAYDNFKTDFLGLR